MIEKILKKLITLLHVSLFFAVIIGPFLPGKYLIYYLFLWPAIYVHWYFNDDRCMLTEIEYSLDKQHYNGLSEYIYNSKSGFFSTLSKVNIHFSNFDSFNEKLNYYRTILWLIVFIRAVIYYKKDIAKGWSIIGKHFIPRFICDSCKA